MTDIPADGRPPLLDKIADHLAVARPDDPFYVFSKCRLDSTARRFLDGFDGLVTYAVKANSHVGVLQTLVHAGVGTFDVASVQEMRQVRAVLPDAVLHYNNPIRSRNEVAAGKDMGVRSWSVDSWDSLTKLGRLPAGSDVAARLHLDVGGGAYDFGSKFGSDVETCSELLQHVAAMGVAPSMTFHPGTQCTDPQAWARYIRACAEVAARAGVRLERLNVGGGFPAQRDGARNRLEDVFGTIRRAVRETFGTEAPRLVCEPGRAMVSEAFALVLKIKQRRAGDGAVFLNDGLYGALGEMRDMPLPDRLHWISGEGRVLRGRAREVTLFGPTCDSLDAVPGAASVPTLAREGDYLVIDGMGAYSLALTSRFNGYGTERLVEEGELISGQRAAAR